MPGWRPVPEPLDGQGPDIPDSGQRGSRADQERQGDTGDDVAADTDQQFPGKEGPRLHLAETRVLVLEGDFDLPGLDGRDLFPDQIDDLGLPMKGRCYILSFLPRLSPSYHI